ncbi:MAG: sigma-70 family RNA polymerase sigma factor [Saprospiraceae bacterium]|nr:sigma-70 family RNA polymerase sigma factor [Candidatus Brachybacter algidus]
MDISFPLDYHERDLITACVRQEEWAIRKVYEDYYRLMMSICLRFAANENDAQDLLHDGFIKVINNFSKFQIGTSLPSWLHRVMVNSCIDHYRKMVRRKTEDIDQVYGNHSLDADAVSKYSEQEILNSIQLLSPTYRTVFVLYAIEGFSHKEIGSHLGITESTSRSNLVKARYKLQDILKRTHR